MSSRTVRVFLAIAFGLGWAFGALMVVFQNQIEAIFGEISGTNPVFILVVTPQPSQASISFGGTSGSSVFAATSGG